MIDTTEAGGGSYPTPPETEEKLYAFTLECSATVERTIWAKNYDDALKQIEDEDYEDEAIISMNIEEIIESKVEE